jgi:transposase
MRRNWDFNEAQKAELQRLAKTHPKAYVRVKALALTHLAEGKTASETAAMVRFHRVSVGEWANRYLAEGAAALEVAEGRGRHSSVQGDEIGRYLRQSPRTFGIDATRWTLSALSQVVPDLKGMSPPGVLKVLARHGYSYKRGQPHLHSPDPDYEEKKGRWIKR